MSLRRKVNQCGWNIQGFRRPALIIDSWDQYCLFNFGKVCCGNIALDVSCVALPCYQPTRRVAILVFYSDNDCVCRCTLSEGLIKGLRSTLILDGALPATAVSHRFWSLVCLHGSSSFSVFVWSHTSLCYLQFVWFHASLTADKVHELLIALCSAVLVSLLIQL